MKTEELQKVMSWLQTTDLVEVSYNQDKKGFSLCLADGTPAASCALPASRYIPVSAPCVGVFQWSEPGRPRKAEEGALAAEGDILGIIETAKGKSAPVKAPADGRIAHLLVEGGAAVEFGQPLLFLES
ncbi:MAG: hypothetical protein A3J74_10030 [Elusimicrobia bacterium RIFCSPHIGHO2_02_FULL_57_9]|nr:MAG: hypothetical protein A3J74_10030 [Elusimicrobia bacterium RIFCSPHIGHO2_02_FULL_57_9]